MLAAAKLREEKEARSRERYQRGELSLDVNDMRADLAEPRAALRRLRGRRPVIIDIHGHYTTAPQALQDFRDAQLAALADPTRPAPEIAQISDDALRESVERNQLRILRERGGDLMLLSPKASAMEHHVPDQSTATAWARASNDLVHRVAQLYPDAFAPVAQLPQTPGGELGPVIDELRRCVDELGFVGCNVNPDPAAGYWTTPPMTDEYWYPLYEAMVELDVPAMVHVSASCNPNFHSLGAHYLNADTSVFMQLVSHDLFDRFPALTFVIPHGGGAVPYHWGQVPRPCGTARPPRPERAVAQRVLRYLCLSSTGNRPAAQGDSHQQRPVRLGDAWCRARRRPANRHRMGRHARLHRPARALRSGPACSGRVQRPAGVPTTRPAVDRRG